LHEEKKKNDRKFEKLMKAIEGLEISKKTDKARPSKRVKTIDSTYSSQHNSIWSSVDDLGQEDSEINSGFVNMSTWFRLLTLRPNL
jgi:hypothetical protein